MLTSKNRNHRPKVQKKAPVKLLFDLFPVILFFISFKVAQSQSDAAMAITNGLLGGGIDPSQAPVLCATTVAIAASIIQVALVLIRGRKVEPMLWISLAIIVVFGGLTLWLHNPLFIKWKPTILYWVFAGILGYGAATRRNFIQKLLGKQLELPAHAWDTLQKAWIGFFSVVGIVNIAVAYTCSTEAWVNFKLFGLLGLTFAFTIAIGFYMARFTTDAADKDGGSQH